jgi:maltose/moltooligosaccharide transporter
MSHYEGVKPKLHFSQILNMCVGFLGIQFGWGLQMANMSSIFDQLHATNIAMLWLAAPLTGLIVQPIIGYLSDNTWHPILGRRRPYFLVGAILSSLALIAMPNSNSLWMAAGLLWVLDASINISMEPFRAFVADKLPEEQRTLGFTTQSFFIGVGTVLASAMPYILTNVFNVSNDSDGQISTSVKLSFYIGAAAFLTFVLYTIFTTKEYPPTSIPTKAQRAESKKGFGAGFKEILDCVRNLPKIMKQLAPVQFFTWVGLFCMWIFFGVTIARSVFGYKDWTGKQDVAFSIIQNSAKHRIKAAYPNDEEAQKGLRKKINRYLKEPGINFPDSIPFTANDLINNANTYFEANKTSDELKDIEANFAKDKSKPISAKIVLDEAYAGKDGSTFINEYKTNKKKFDDGTEWGGNCFALYSLVTFLFAFLLPQLANRIGKKRTHAICLFLGGLGLFSIMFITNKFALLASMTGVGILWASTLSMPYAMLSNKVPENKMGIFMGIFNFFIVIPEIVSALSFDYILEHIFNFNRAAFLGTGGILMFIAALFCFRISESD